MSPGDARATMPGRLLAAIQDYLQDHTSPGYVFEQLVAECEELGIDAFRPRRRVRLTAAMCWSSHRDRAHLLQLLAREGVVDPTAEPDRQGEVYVDWHDGDWSWCRPDQLEDAP